MTTFRRWLFGFGVAAVLLSVLPPLATEARRYEWVESLQFCLLAVVGPALLVCGAQWRLLGLSSGASLAVDDDGHHPEMSGAGWIDRLAVRRRQDSSLVRSIIVQVAYIGAVVAWRVPVTVDQLQRHGWLVLLEAATFLVVGVGLWLELVESPPVSPRRPRPHRVAMAAISMWVIWTLAYLVGLSSNSWYHGFNHLAGSGISVSADQQLSTAVMWLLSAAAFMPVVFWNLVHWLQQDEDPDDELYRLIRQERRSHRTETDGSA